MWKRWGKPAIGWCRTSHMDFIAPLPEALRMMRELIDQYVAG